MANKADRAHALRLLVSTGPEAGDIKEALLTVIDTLGETGGSAFVERARGGVSLMAGQTPVLSRVADHLWLALPVDAVKKSARVTRGLSTSMGPIFGAIFLLVPAARFGEVMAALRGPFVTLMKTLRSKAVWNASGRLTPEIVEAALATPKTRSKEPAPEEPAGQRRSKPVAEKAPSLSTPRTGEIARAISIRQPWAELILRGIKKEEYRSRLTHIRERVYIYASLGRADHDDEQDARMEHGIDVDRLPRGVLVGTVEITDCYDNGSGFAYVLDNPERLRKHLPPTKHPQPCFFNPF